ncbi:VAMP713 protein [Hibiscus syriacus]|uniref:VAMP713 protein n=1 Tax=Hibiscus syriacus TaxID=106335 RepID=A0A6A3CU39_HIBSY|nr:ankyrin repeat-containing protein At2g01680-like isoform X1 [Hibiscus syriacus]KAE8730748.1 VAMP713 protein [Hibiscus syriacus]
MENKLYNACLEGNKSELLNLLQEDALLLDRFITGRYPETPLHVASMLGHLEFVDEILTRKPELAKEVDSRNSSPLHLASAKGYLQIVKRLLQVDPDMCLVSDIDGRNPLHTAAMKGHFDVLKELVQARPWAARVLMDQSETILHACVRCNQLEALTLLVERVSDHEFLNCKNHDGNTILHLAIAAKQTKIINLLISSTTIDVNCVNEDGFTALDLLSRNQRDAIDKEIVESLRRMGATHGQDKPLSNSQLKAIRTKILSSTWDQPNAASKSKKRKDGKRSVKNKNGDWLERKRNTLMLVASLLAAMAFQAGINPPSGVWQDNGPSGFSSTESNGKNHTAGFSVLADNHQRVYTLFIAWNTTGFLASLSIILMLISGLPLRRRFFMWVLMVIMWVAITAMALTYLECLVALTPDHQNSLLITILGIAVLVWIGLMLILLLGHMIRVLFRLIKYLRKSVMRLMRLMNPIATRPALV